jgi:hypothetical protein
MKQSVFVWIVTIYTVLITLGSSTTARGEDPPLVGFWESVETAQGGIGSALLFTADGRFRQTAVVAVETRYRLDGAELVLEAGPGTETAQTIPVVFGPDTMTMTSPDGKQLHKKRFRKQSGDPSPLLGDWTYAYAGQGTCFERYSADGNMQFRLPLKTEAGTYRIDKQRVRLQPNRGKIQKWSFERTGDTLRIGPKGSLTQYRQVKEGRWYTLEEP